MFAFFAAMAETERENIRESTLEGLDTATRKGKHGGRPPVITDDMLHTVLRLRAPIRARVLGGPRHEAGIAALVRRPDELAIPSAGATDRRTL